IGAIFGEHPAERGGGDRAQREQRAREGAQPRLAARGRAARLAGQLHPHPPPTDPVAPRAPSRVSNTCCRYVLETGSRLKDLIGSAKCSRSYGLTHGSGAAHPASAASSSAAVTARIRFTVTLQAGGASRDAHRATRAS